MIRRLALVMVRNGHGLINQSPFEDHNTIGEIGCLRGLILGHRGFALIIGDRLCRRRVIPGTDKRIQTDLGHRGCQGFIFKIGPRDRSLDDIFEFANIAGPIMRHEAFERLRGHAWKPLPAQSRHNFSAKMHG